MVKKKKRLKIHPDDHVIGMQEREKRDLFAGCNEPGKEWFHPDPHVFMKAFCRLCKSADCIRARGAVSPWHTRMAEQVDYLLNDPNFSEMQSPDHLRLAGQVFEDMRHKAERLEIARKRQDWTIPEENEGPTDGYNKLAAPDTTDQFDDAVKKLARARGKEEPDLPVPQAEDAPAHFEPQVGEEDPYEYETDFPSSDGVRTYHVTFDKGGRWACECDGFRYASKCKHVNTVREWYSEQLEQAEEEEDEPAPAPAPAPRPPPPAAAKPPQDPRVPPAQRPMNTTMPQGGVMLGGDASKPQETPVQDPWAISKETVVAPGAQVTLKGKKKP